MNYLLHFLFVNKLLLFTYNTFKGELPTSTH